MPSLRIIQVEILIVRRLEVICNIFIIQDPKSMEGVINPSSRVAYVPIWIIKDTIPTEIAQVIEFSFIDCPISKMMFSVCLGAIKLCLSSYRIFLDDLL